MKTRFFMPPFGEGIQEDHEVGLIKDSDMQSDRVDAYQWLIELEPGTVSFVIYHLPVMGSFL